MHDLTTDHLRRSYGKGPNNDARGALNYMVRDGYEHDPVADIHRIAYSRRTATVIGIDEHERDGATLSPHCSECGPTMCHHALGVLWHRALVREGVTKEDWWEREKERRIREEPLELEISTAVAQAGSDIRRAMMEAQVSDIGGFSFEIDPMGRTARPLYHGRSLSSYDQQVQGLARHRYSPAYAPPAYNPARKVFEAATGALGTLAMLHRAMTPVPGTDAVRLDGANAAIFLDAAIRHGAARTTDGLPLKRGSTLNLTPAWQLEEDGTQRFGIQGLDPDRHATMRLGDDVVIDLHAGTMHAVDYGMTTKVFDAMARMKPVSAEMSVSMRTALVELVGEKAAPSAIRIERRTHRPRARITLDETTIDGKRRQQAQIAVEYRNEHGDDVAVGGRRRMVDGRLVIDERDTSAAARILAAIPDDSLARGETVHDGDTRTVTFDGDEVASLAFRRDVLPSLDEATFHVERTVNWNSDLRHWGAGEHDLDVEEGVAGALSVAIAPDVSGLDRNILAGLVELARTVEAETDPELVSTVFDGMLERPHHPVRHAEDGVMLVPTEVLMRLLPAIWTMVHMGGLDEGGGMNSLGIADLPGLGSSVTLRLPDRIRRLLALRAAAANTKRIRVPRGFSPVEKVDKAQLEGLRWMRTLHEAGYGGILADEVGVGKTLQLLLHAMSLQQDGKLEDQALMVVPKTSVKEWKIAMARFFPDMRFIVWEGPLRREETFRLREGTIVLTTPYSVVNDAEIRDRPWSLVGIDEAQDARNPLTELAKALREIEADQKIPTSGTPVENNLGDAWSLMEIACPGLLGTPTEFNTGVRKPIEKERSSQRREQFSRFMEPFVLRRTREQAGHKIPKPEQIDHIIPVDQAQARLYETIRLTSQGEFQRALASSGNSWRMSVLPIITRLRQSCCHPVLVKANYAKTLISGCPSAKTDEVVKTALECKAEGRRILAFSTWTEHLDLVRDRLEAVGLTCAMIHGKMSSKQRDASLDRFRDVGDIDVLLITTKTGGRSLNIPQADDVFILDPWWNPQPEIQAIGRTQRRGQTKVIRVHRFIVQDSIETRIMKIQARKIAIAETLYVKHGKGAVSDALTIDDMNVILMPLGWTEPVSRTMH